jgi:MYXO-CTERM domain-containing protein
MDAFVTSGFSNADVNALTNDGKLPFIFAVACVTGAFDQGTCFGESWLRATHNGAPTGAIGAYMSSINQSWDPPMAGQDEADRLLVNEAAFSYGALCFAGSGKMMDDYAADGVAMFDTWIVFGDPSVRVYGVAQPPSGIGVQPFPDFAATGDPGGPFTPSEIVYTVHNYSTFPVDWTASYGSPWLSVDPSSGTLQPDAEVPVTVGFAALASALGNGHYADTVSFVNATDHTGDTTRGATLDLGHPVVQQQWPLDQDPGWTVEGQWAFGPPAGLGGETGGPDPTSGHTGANVYGYNLQGDYASNIPEHNLTTPAIDCSHLAEVSVKFWRWLGVEHPAFDRASVTVSTDGQSWTTVWQNPSELSDTQWTQQEIDLTAVAAGQPTVYLRWTMGPTDGGATYCGWNIDDIELWGLEVVNCWDVDGDGHYDVACGGDDCNDADAAIHPGAVEACGDGIDNDCDGLTDGADPSCNGQGGNGAGGAGPGGSPGDGAAPDDSGCGCRTAGGPPATGAPWAILVGLGLAGLRRRRAG